MCFCNRCNGVVHHIRVYYDKRDKKYDTGKYQLFNSVQISHLSYLAKCPFEELFRYCCAEEK